MKRAFLFLLLIIFTGQSYAQKTENELDSLSESNIKIQRANQIFKTLLPDENVLVYADGIAVDDVVLRFDEENPQFPIIEVQEEKIDEENVLYLHLCCIKFDEYEDWETLEGHSVVYKTWSYRLTPTQFVLAQELKTIIEKIMSNEKTYGKKNDR